MSSEACELPAVFRHHVFCCYQQRPPGHPRGSCGASGAAPLWDHLGKQLQLSREARPWPQLVIKRRPESIFDYAYDDFEVLEYQHHAPIKAPVAV